MTRLNAHQKVIIGYNIEPKQRSSKGDYWLPYSLQPCSSKGNYWLPYSLQQSSLTVVHLL